MSLSKQIDTATNFDIILNFLGWGDPLGHGYWFFGIEESEIINEDNIVVRKGKQYRTLHKKELFEEIELIKKRKKRLTQIYRITSELLIRSGYINNYNVNQSYDYMIDRLYQKGSGVFQGNLYPLGRKRIHHDFSKTYNSLFGNYLKDYHAEVRQKRFSTIYDFWNINKPKLTVCFGSTYWGDFEETFRLKNNKYTDYKWSRVYEDDKIVFTPFFANNHMSRNRIVSVANKLLAFNK